MNIRRETLISFNTDFLQPTFLAFTIPCLVIIVLKTYEKKYVQFLLTDSGYWDTYSQLRYFIEGE